MTLLAIIQGFSRFGERGIYAGVDSSRLSFFRVFLRLLTLWVVHRYSATCPLLFSDGNELNGHVPTEVGKLRVLESLDIRKFFYDDGCIPVGTLKEPTILHFFWIARHGGLAMYYL